eukprot:scaffold83943_cov18-Tisochrysis_lutea.AAC.1
MDTGTRSQAADAGLLSPATSNQARMPMALQVCKALGKIPARERDVLTHHMQFFYGPSFAKADPNYYTDNTWNTW